MKSLSLKNTLTLNFVFVATLPLIITAFWGLYNLSNNMEREITNKNYILAKSIAGELEVILGHPLLHLKQIRDVTERKDIVSPDDLNDYFTSLIEVNRVFDMIKVLDDKGIVTHLAPFDENILGLDMSNQEYYRSSLNTDKHYWSKTFISSQTGMPTLALTLPLKQGLLVGHLNLSHLNKITDRAKISDLEDVVITDNNGVVIVHPKGELVCERFNVKHLNHIQQGLTGIEGTFKYYLEGVEKIGSVVTVPQTGWLVAISQSVDEAFEPITKLRNFIYVSIMVAIIIAVLISLTNLRRILHPLIQFAEESKRIAGGDYTYKLSEVSYSEIDNLNSSFKTMIDAVKTREDALRDEITERKQAENKLIKNQYCLTKAQEIGIIGTWELDIQKNILKWTDENYKIFGVPVGTEMNYEIFLNCVHPDDRDYVHEKWNAGLNKEPYDIEHRLIVDDKVKWVNEKADIEFDTEGNPIMAIGFTQEITDRKQAEEELSKYRDHLEELVENRTDELKEKTDKIEASRKALTYLVEDVNKAREELEKANEKLKELDRLKSMFIASMSHELRTPLNSIIGFTGIILLGLTGEINAEQKDQLQRVSGSAKHLLNLITDIIDISKIEAGKVEVYAKKVNLNRVIEEAVSTLKPEIDNKGLGLEISMLPDMQLTTDRKRLLQCILNLLSNAVKFTEKGKIEIAAQEVDGMMEIRVKDTGVGIKEEDIPKLFKSFVRLDTPLKTVIPGTGLGLYLTKKLTTEVLKGSVSVESKYGEGSTFVLRVVKEI